MSPRDFCNWFQGVLDMAKAEDGSVALRPTQVEKIDVKLIEAAEYAKKFDAQQQSAGGRPPHIGGPGDARC